MLATNFIIGVFFLVMFFTHMRHYIPEYRDSYVISLTQIIYVISLTSKLSVYEFLLRSFKTHYINGSSATIWSLP